MHYLIYSSRRIAIGLMLLMLIGSTPEEYRLRGASTPHPNEPVHTDSIKIGLVAPDSESGRAIQNAARMAIAHANRSGGFEGRPFQLVTRSDEGLWGSGSKNISRLIFEDQVLAVVGSLDGRSAHLVEQIITKARVVYLSPWVSDPTLAQANIPWFFRCVPDDEAQSRALINEIIKKRLRRVVTISDGSYDGNMARDIFTKRAKADGLVVLNAFDVSQAGSSRFVEGVRRSNPEAILLFGQPSKMARVLRDMRKSGLKQPLFGPLLLYENAFVQEASKYTEPTVLITPGYSDEPSGVRFRKDYLQRYKHPPTTAAAYTYDSVTAIIESIRQGGLDRWKIRDALATIHYEEGVTGEIRFDENGNRIGRVTVTEL